MNNKRFKKNVIANYFGQFYLAFLGIIIVPLYLARLGPEGYGLIGLFTMIQGWLQILDMGMSATLAREASISVKSVVKAVFFKKLKKLVNFIFFICAISIIFTGILSLEWLVDSWLNTNMDRDVVSVAILLIILTVSVRWLTGPNRSTLLGLERQVELNVINIIIATFKFPGSLIVLLYTDNSVKYFFFYQFFVGLLEFFVLYFLSSYYASYKKSVKISKSFIIESIPTLKFSMSVAATSSIWVVVTKFDKLLLSGILPLDEYGYFSIAVLASGIIMIISQPLAQALLPRITSLSVDGKEKEVIAIYRKITRITVIVVAPFSVFLGAFSYQVVLLWTGDIITATNVSPILRWYAWGNGILAVSSFPYFLQYAKGNIKYHIIGSLSFLVLMLPSLYFLTLWYGALGAGVTWFSINLIYLLVWNGYIHRIFAPGVHLTWIFCDILPFILPATLLSFLYFNFFISNEHSLLLLFVFGAGSYVLNWLFHHVLSSAFKYKAA